MEISFVLAYLDAGTGSLILQALAGVFITLVVFFKSFGYKVKNALGFKKNKKSQDDSE